MRTSASATRENGTVSELSIPSLTMLKSIPCELVFAECRDCRSEVFVRLPNRTASQVHLLSATGDVNFVNPGTRAIPTESWQRWYFWSNDAHTRLKDESVKREYVMEYTNRRLMWHGMLLFLIGLLTGFAETHFTNTRMGLAAHLEGVMNGIFLLALGAIWNEVHVSPRTKRVAYWIALFGTYGNWFVTTLAAVFGTGALSPITAAGRSGQPWQENFVTLGFLLVGATIIATSVLVLWGLRGKASS
jgi:hydroxylaminobenzene mutase